MNHELVTKVDSGLYADSRIVATGFGIEHHSLAKSLSEHFTDLKSVNLSQSGSSGGRPVKAYLLTERQVMMLPAICSVTPQLKAFQERLVDAFIAARDGRSTPLFDIPKTYADALIEAGNQAKRADAAEAKVAELEPKAAFAEQITASVGWLEIAAVAAELNIPGMGEENV